MAASREVLWLNMFNGGLYLTAQTHDLDKQFSPDLLNVDLGQKGGFVLRGGFHAQDRSPFADGAKFICASYFGVDVLLVQGNNGRLFEWDGAWPVSDSGQVTDQFGTTVRGQPFQSALGGVTYNRIYLSNCWSGTSLNQFYWDGSQLGSLTQIWNDDYLSPSMGNMPLSRFVKQHNGYQFVADTVESGVRYPHRVRFSHQNFPESWAEDDWFDVDPTDDGDPITGLVQFRDMLVIFKRTSVWALYGPNKDTWVLERITSASGVSDQRAVDVNSGVLYWFATDGRLMGFNGKDTTYMSAPLQWWSDLGYILHGGDHRVMWSDGRLWLSVETSVSSGVIRGLFVWDPTAKAWTRYDRLVFDMFHWERVGQDDDPLFVFENDEGIYRYDRIYSTDTDTDGVPTRIDGYYRTAWLDADETATKKRWKRPWITSAADADATLEIRTFYDFNENANRRLFTQSLVAPLEATLWGPPDPLGAGIPPGPLGPGTQAGGNMVWGESNWYYRDADYYGFDRLGAAGSARAIQFKISSPNNSGRWWMDSMAIPFRRKQVK